jgi:hypothetical protein
MSCIVLVILAGAVVLLHQIKQLLAHVKARILGRVTAPSKFHFQFLAVGTRS